MKSDESLPEPKPEALKPGDNKPAEKDSGPPPETVPTTRTDEVPIQSTSAPSLPDNIDLSKLDIIDEILRDKIRRIIGEPPRQSKWQRFSGSPLASVFLGFLLTGLIGGFLTHYYSVKQKEIEMQRISEQRESDRLYEERKRESDRMREDQQRETDRAMEDERRKSDRLYQEQQKQIESLRSLQQKEGERLYARRQKDLDYSRSLQQQAEGYTREISADTNKKRLQKIIEAWEKLDKLESEIGRILEKVSLGRSTDKQKDADSILALALLQDEIVYENRVNFGPKLRAQAQEYLKISGKYAAYKLLGMPDSILDSLLKQRNQLKPDIRQIQAAILEEEATPNQ